MTNHKFNLERAKAGSPVVTRDGRKARIVCFDKRGEEPLIVLTQNRFHQNVDCVDYYPASGFFNGVEGSIHDLFMAAPSIPADCIKYDPNVPPPDMAAELEMFYSDRQEKTRFSTNVYKHDWEVFNLQVGEKRTHYRVTKWKLPEGFKPHMGGERPADAVGSGKVCFSNGTVQDERILEAWNWIWTNTQHDWGTNIIGYLPDAKENDIEQSVDKIAMFVYPQVAGGGLGKTRGGLKNLLNQFAAAIIAECKK